MTERNGRQRRATTRRLFCAAVGAGVLAGCLDLEPETDDEANGSENQTDDTGEGPSTPPDQTPESTPEPEESLALTEAWRSDGLTHTFLVDGQVVGRDSPNVRMYSFDGELRWESQSSDPDSYTVWPSNGSAFARNGAAVFVHYVSFGSGDEHDAQIYAFDADDGTELWSHGTDNDRITAMTATEETVYYAARPFDRGREETPIRALDAETREHRWERTLGERGHRPGKLVARDDRLYVLQDRLRVLDAADGETQRTIELPAGTSNYSIEDGTLYLIGNNETVAMALDDEEIEWSAEYDGGANGSTRLVDGVLYSGDGAGYVTAHDIEADEQLWEYRVDGAVWNRPAVDSGIVWVYDENGIVYAIDAADGDRLYRRGINDDDGAVTAFDGRVYIPGPYYHAYDIERR